jgi:1-deoxy-D-xylulose-5-phosphate reductoisomerase
MVGKSVTILGSTGSIGKNTLDVIAQQPESCDVQVLTAHRNVALLAAQARRFKPRHVVIADETRYADLKNELSGQGIEVAAGASALVEAAALPTNWTMTAIVGMAGLSPLMAAIERGTTVAVANKEPLVAAGALVMAAARQHGATILPVDSEHSAIFQVFEAHNRAQIARLILTASGGPFRTWTKSDMDNAAPEQALAHPNWRMGQKISIDSATMMNKALEVIEARHLFDMPGDKIDVLVHPQSVVHSMVEYADGSVLSQMGSPDMRTPIAFALGYPERMPSPAHRLDLRAMPALTFEAVDDEKFPAVKMAYEVLKSGQPAAAIAFNAANEIAVEAYLAGRISFGRIVPSMAAALENAPDLPISTLADVLAVDCAVRERVRSAIGFPDSPVRKAM